MRASRSTLLYHRDRLAICSTGSQTLTLASPCGWDYTVYLIRARGGGYGTEFSRPPPELGAISDPNIDEEAYSAAAASETETLFQPLSTGSISTKPPPTWTIK